jgi:hypothetical protein
MALRGKNSLRDKSVAMEVKGDGEHGILFCSPSIHKNGYRYEIIGTKAPVRINEDYELHIDNICRKYGLTYLDDDTFESRVAGLVEPSHRNKEGHRHKNTLAVINHYIYKNFYKLPEDQQTEQQLEEIISISGRYFYSEITKGYYHHYDMMQHLILRYFLSN